MNYKYVCLNPIADVGLDNLTDNYARTEDFAAADAAFVRSARRALWCSTPPARTRTA